MAFKITDHPAASVEEDHDREWGPARRRIHPRPEVARRTGDGLVLDLTHRFWSASELSDLVEGYTGLVGRHVGESRSLHLLQLR